MNYLTLLWLCVATCSVHGIAVAQSSGLTEQEIAESKAGTEVSKASERSNESLDEVRVLGALRSEFLKKRSRSPETEAPKANLAEFKRSIQPVLEQACVECHGPDVQEGNIRIDTLDPDLLLGQDVTWWLEVLAVLSKGEMPPPDEGELADESRKQVIEWLSSEVQLASTFRRATGGHSSFRRMTRYEYNYALQDLLGVPWDFAKDLPPDANSEDGFQNSSELLHMSVTQFEMYRQIALKALQRVTVPVNAQGELSARPPMLRWAVTMQEAAEREWPAQEAQLEEIRKKFKDNPVQQQQELDQLTASFAQPHSRTYYRQLSSGRTARAEWSYNGAKYAFEPHQPPPGVPADFDVVAILPPGRNQYLTIELGDRIPDEGTMRVRARASRASEEATRVPSLQLAFGWQASNEGRAEMIVSAEDTPIEAGPGNPGIYEWEFPLGEIYPRNSVRGVSSMGALPSPSEYIRLINSTSPQGGPADIQVDFVEIETPVYEQWPPQSHRQIFFDSDHREDESIYAREVLTAFMEKAWRREISNAEVAQKIKLFEAMRGECESLEQAMVEVLATVLASPHFIYISLDGSDADHEGAAQPRPSRLSAEELATRLSVFLWCSIPDAELLQLAASEQIFQPVVLKEQVERMLADPRAERFSEHFVRQWLNLQLLDYLNLNQDQKPERFDPLLKQAMQQEPVELFQEILRKDESVLNFIHTDYAMLNERLALHYGIRDVAGNHFRRVQLDTGFKRGGLLTQAGLLAMNSDGVDSHPLKRGVWLLERLLNDPPPPPPPAVPVIDLADPEIAKLTLKQRIEDHRNQAACISCHVKVDPWGIAFENYDAKGLWRDNINGEPVDATSQLFNKEQLDGMEGLKRFLLKNRQDQFVRALVEKLATYALGRPLAFSDLAEIDGVTADVRQQGDGLATIIHCVVESELFQAK